MTELTDPTTGLTLRSNFEQAVATERLEGRPYAIAVVDADHLSLVNRTRGFAVGDAALLAIADRLRSVLSRSDTVCRIAGDSFAVLITDATYAATRVVAERMRRAIDDHPIVIDGLALSLTVSVGIAKGGEQTLDVLLSQAEAACAAAKHTGRNAVVPASLTDDHQIAHLQEASMVTQIRHAVAQGGFALHAQRIHALGSFSHPPASEMLVRMRIDDDLLITPESFVPRAELSDLIHLIDLWVMRAVSDHLHSSTDPDEHYFVNVSPKSIETPGFVDELTDAIQALPINPSRLCFELTETAAVDHFDRVLRFADRMHALGARIALDDFGSGTSSLSHLRQLPVDYLKIDGSLTRDVATDPTARALITAIGSIAAVRNVTTVAEHIETAEEARVLEELGVHLGQGFHLSRPAALANS